MVQTSTPDGTWSRGNELMWLREEVLAITTNQDDRDRVYRIFGDAMAVEREHCPHPSHRIRCWQAQDVVCAMCCDCGAGWER